MTEPLDPLRPTAQAEPYVRVLGRDAAILFFLAFGGTEIYIAQNPKSRSRVVALLGRDKAEALAEAAHLLPRRVPLCKPWIAAVARAVGLPPENTPLSGAEIARRLHATDVTVRKWLSRRPKPPPKTDQLKLF